MLRLFRDVVRILSVTENLLYLAGKSLQRRAMRNGLLISLAYSSTILRTNYINAQELSPEQLTALIIGGFASYPAGTLLVRIANFLTRDNLQAAAAGYLHLTSHYKQSQVLTHLHFLWHEVFASEHISVSSAHETQHPTELEITSFRNQQDEVLLHLFQEQPTTNRKEQLIYQNFVQSAADALRSPLPMGVQSARIGFHLGPIEDWYEKGFFSYEDFPAKAIFRDPLIKRCQKLTTSPIKYQLHQWLSPEATPSFWHAFTVRKFGTRVGRSLGQLNQLAERQGFPDFFDAQHFIWPSTQLDDTVRQRFNQQPNSLADKLFSRRQELFRNLFSEDQVAARRHIMRMFVRDYAFIMKLRLSFDVLYAGDKLAAKPAEELRQIERLFSIQPISQKFLDRCKNSALSHIENLDDFLAQHPVDNADEVEIENLHQAYHVDYHGLRSRFIKADNENLMEELLKCTSDEKADLAVLRELLHRVRIYHVLIKLQIHAYWSIVLNIGRL
ncbi:MAG: hypothetical protein ACI8P9_000184 [Parasphingorhabdus sp.]|jgi:hypothetical protein